MEELEDKLNRLRDEAQKRANEYNINGSEELFMHQTGIVEAFDVALYFIEQYKEKKK